MRDGDVRGFLHVCCIGGYREVLWEIVHALLESRLYDRSALIEMAVLGSEADQQIVADLVRPFPRFRIAYRSTELDQYEFPSLGLLQDVCRTWDGPVYYLHTKGVSHSPHNLYARYWRRHMLDEIVANHEHRLIDLESADTAGANWSADHYAGNFWWARASHIRRLPDICELQRNPRPVVWQRTDGEPETGRGVGPRWNQRLQCEYWLHMVPGRAGRAGPGKSLNLYRELRWTTPAAEIVAGLLGASAGRRLASIGPGPQPAADGGYDVIAIDVRARPRAVLELIEDCLPRLAPDGAVVVRHTNPPSPWHQRTAPEAQTGSEWTGQVWRAVVEFRIGHPHCEVFTVDTDFGCTVIRPGRPARRRIGAPVPDDLDWPTFVRRRDELLNLVDVPWFRRHLHADGYFTAAAAPSTVVELLNALIAADGVDSCLQIGTTADALEQLIAPIRHRVDAAGATADAGLDRYELVVAASPDDLPAALTRLAAGGWIVISGRPPGSFLDAHPEFDCWTCELDLPHTVLRHHADASQRHRSPGDALLDRIGRRDSARPVDAESHVAVGIPSQRRLTPQPYAGNRAVLLAAVELDPDDLRSTLHLGDSYFDTGDFTSARRWYSAAVGMRDWWWDGLDQEIYRAMLRIAQSMTNLGEPWPDVCDTYLRAWEFSPEHTEPLRAIAFHYRTQQRYRLGYLYARPAADIPNPEDWRAWDELALCAFEIDKRVEAFDLWRRVLDRTDLPAAARERIVQNLDACVPAMLEASSPYPAAVVRSLGAAAGDPGVAVSLVAGPLRSLVEQTLNSFLNCCRDIAEVGRFLVIDLGLSAEDRAFLQQRYGFLQFTTAPTAEWADIRDLIDARLWLHLGEGWRFFAPGQLIGRLAAALDADPDIAGVAVNAGDSSAEGPVLFDTDRLDRSAGTAAIGCLDEVSCIRPMLTTVIGRGNSGTRAISRTLIQSGVFMGEPIKADSADLVPAADMYEACRIISRYIPWRGGLNWDFGPVQTMPIPAEFTQLVESYLASVLNKPAPRAGWKLPETTLCYPWIRRLFPDIHYIFWVRDPRDCITRGHFTDDLADFGIDYPRTDDLYRRRAISWKYQDDLVEATPRPRHWMSVRMEDFIDHQDRELGRLADFLGFALAPIPVYRDSIGRHQRRPGVLLPEFLTPALRKYHYDSPGDESS